MYVYVVINAHKKENTVMEMLRYSEKLTGIRIFVSRIKTSTRQKLIMAILDEIAGIRD